MINVISQTTAERQQETAELFEQCRPYLEKGMSLRKAVHQGTNRKVSNTRNGWFVELKEYAKTQGYDYNKMKWKRGLKK